MQKGKGVAQEIQRYSHYLIVVSSRVKIWHTEPPTALVLAYEVIMKPNST